MLLKSKKILVTGSSAGIGLGIVEACAKQGAKVVATSEKPLEKCPEVQRLIEQFDVSYLQVDITQPGRPRELVSAAWEKLGGLHVLINNVGTFREPSFLDLKKQDFDFLFNLNVWVAIEASQEFARRVATEGKGGRILFTTSLNGSRSEPAHTLYDASKGAINALTRQLAIELAPFQITTAAIAPGLVETPLTDMGLRSDPEARRQVESQIPIRRIATVDDIAGWFVFLASDLARYATGTVIPVDGGLDAQQMPMRPITEGELLV
jgi:glucose 1-dehydrogenase